MQTIHTEGDAVLVDLINGLAANGRSNFSLEDIEKLKKSSPAAVTAALRRLQAKGEIAVPYRGFFAIVPPEYRALGCIPAEQFIPDLMDYLKVVYYVGLLSAAEYHGAAHHRPQVFQVVTAQGRRPIRCGKVGVEFVFKKNADLIPTQPKNTPAGTVKIATPEATAFDLIGYVSHCGGLDNVATILAELHEKIDASRLVEAAGLSPVAWAQRLGYLMDMVGGQEKTTGLASYIKDKTPVRAPLMPAGSVKGAKMDSRWRLFVNAKVETDL
jgi:predicted transcriptional regulator of viral defense system